MRKTRIGAEPAFRRTKRLLILLLPLALVTACEQYPRDPQGSLNQIEQSGQLHVGVITNPPWIIGNAPDSPVGVEARLMEQFARDLGVDVVWHWGNAQKLFEGLSRYELHVVVGGITSGNPWKLHAGFSIPYFSAHAVVGTPKGHASLSSLKGVTVAVRQGEGFSKKVKGDGGRIQFVEGLAAADMPAAAPDWEIDALGMKNTGITLQKSKHVLAVPKGENALLMRLEAFLLENADRQTITRMIATEAER